MNTTFRPLPSKAAVMAGLQAMAIEQPPSGRPASKRQLYYSEAGLMRDFPSQFIRGDTLAMPAVKIVRPPRIVVEPEGSKEIIPATKYF